MRSFFHLFVFLVATNYAVGKIFSRCELARELKRQGFTDLSNWVCLIEAESGRNTAAKGGPNSNRSYDWGLFQINDKYWCKVGSNGGDCNTNCNNLITPDITIASNCAKKIFKRHGFNAWYGWIAKCKGKPLPNLSACFSKIS